MELSSMLHKYINQGRGSRSDSLKATSVKLTDAQLCALWEKAMSLEVALENMHDDIKKIARKKYK